jgi:two-component system sensor histidine kinase VicK
MKKNNERKTVSKRDDFYRLVLKSMADYSVFTMDKEGIINTWNEGAEKIFGYTKKEAIGKSCSLIFTHLDQQSKLPEKLRAIALKKGKVANEHYYIRKDGCLFWASGLTFKLEDKNHHHTGFTKIVRDLTDKKQFEVRQDDFISTATHELRSPLTAIRLYADMAQNQSRHLGNGALITTVSKLSAQITRMGALMDYLLDVTKIEKDKLVLEKTKFNLQNLTKEILQPAILNAKEHAFTIHNTLKHEICADKNRINQVITNLVTNAVKYSPVGGKIIVTTSQGIHGAEFSVQDFGVGISEGEQSKVFNRFFRADVTRHTKIAGVGLGLYIAQKIIKSHHGRIWMVSTKNQGSTFSFSLPMKIKEKSC